MPDPITAVNTMIVATKTLLDINKRIKNAEMATILSSLLVSAADVKVELADEREAAAALKNRIQELESKLEVRANIEYRDNVIFLNSEHMDEGPYCPRCWGKDEKLVKLIEIHEPEFPSRGCLICKFVQREDASGFSPGIRSHLVQSYLC